jgi:hypothetical protein
LETVFPSSFASPGSFRSWGFRLIAIARSTASAWALLGGWSPSKAAEVADSPLAPACPGPCHGDLLPSRQ